MFVAFEKLNDNAKIWIYQANRVFNESELSSLHAALKTFVESWTAHDKALEASYEIRRNQFIVLAVDENTAQASGCSIDKSVHFMKIIEEELRVQLFNRMLLAFEENNQIITLPKSEFGVAVQSGRIKADTLVVNNMVFTKAALDSKWLLPFAQSWHAQLFPQLTV